MKHLMLFFILLKASTVFADDELTFTDYTKLDHSIEIVAFRSGNHDKSGINAYYFEAKVFAVNNSKDEQNKEIADRKTLPGDVIHFADLEIPVLRNWEPDLKAKTAQLTTKISGDQIRALVSNAIREWSITEADIAVMVEICLSEQNKFLGFFGDDTSIAKSVYFPIRMNRYQIGGRTHLKLTLTDGSSTEAQIRIKYDFPEEEKAPTTNEAVNTTAEKKP